MWLVGGNLLCYHDVKWVGLDGGSWTGVVDDDEVEMGGEIQGEMLSC